MNLLIICFRLMEKNWSVGIPWVWAVTTETLTNYNECATVNTYHIIYKPSDQSVSSLQPHCGIITPSVLDKMPKKWLLLGKHYVACVTHRAHWQLNEILLWEECFKYIRHIYSISSTQTKPVWDIYRFHVLVFNKTTCHAIRNFFFIIICYVALRHSSSGAEGQPHLDTTKYPVVYAVPG